MIKRIRDEDLEADEFIVPPPSVNGETSDDLTKVWIVIIYSSDLPFVAFDIFLEYGIGLKSVTFVVKVFIF